MNNSTFFVVVLVSLLLFQILGNPKHGLLGQTFLKPGLETVLTGFKNLTRNSKSCLKPEFETLPLAENPVLNSNPDSAQPFELQMCLMKCPVEKRIYSNPSAFLKVKASHARVCMSAPFLKNPVSKRLASHHQGADNLHLRNAQ